MLGFHAKFVLRGRRTDGKTICCAIFQCAGIKMIRNEGGMNLIMMTFISPSEEMAEPDCLQPLVLMPVYNWLG